MCVCVCVCVYFFNFVSILIIFGNRKTPCYKRGNYVQFLMIFAWGVTAVDGKSERGRESVCLAVIERERVCVCVCVCLFF